MQTARVIASNELKWRVTLGLLAAAARLVPVPFLDDILRARAYQLLVSRTLRAHGRTCGSSAVSPLYGGGDGCMHGCLAGLAMVPIKLLLFPIRKLLAYVLAAKWLARDLTEALLLGRILDRRLEAGALSTLERGPLFAEAERVRRAFDNAMAGTDLTLVRASLAGALRAMPGVVRAALHALRRLKKNQDDDAALPDAERRALDAQTDRLAAAFDTPEIRAVLERFDQRFDESLRVLEQRG